MSEAREEDLLFVGGDPIEDDPAEPEDFGNDLGTEPEPDEPEPEAPEPDEPEPEAEAPEPEAPADEPEAPEPDAPTDERQAATARIPKARFDEVNAKRKNAEERVRLLEEELARRQGTPPAETFDFDAKEKEYMNCVVDGEFDKATVLRKEIRAAEQAQIRSEMEQTRNQAVAMSQAELVMRETVEALEKAYPQFDKADTATYDPVATDEALELHQAYMQIGKYSSAPESLRAAVELIALKYGYVAPAAEEAAVDPEPAAPPAPPPARRRAQIAASAQPRLPARGPKRAPGVASVREMSEAEFDALPAAKLAEMRGDFLG